VYERSPLGPERFNLASGPCIKMSLDMLRCMRTTIRLDDHLLEEARQLAARTGRTLSKVVEDAVREVVARGNAQHTPNQQLFRLRTFRGRELGQGSTSTIQRRCLS
jgi:hypothetical protein